MIILYYYIVIGKIWTWALLSLRIHNVYVIIEVLNTHLSRQFKRLTQDDLSHNNRTNKTLAFTII